MVGLAGTRANHHVQPLSLRAGDPLDDAAAQQAYFDAIAAGGYVSFFEGFTASPWDDARSTISGGTHVAVSVDSQGITWRSSDGDYITTADASSGVTPWHIYSKGGSPEESLHAVPATLIGESSSTLYGIGMWVSGGPPDKGVLHVILDDTLDLKFQRITGYDNNVPPEPIKETMRLSSAKQFYGVLAPDGFTKFQLLEVEGTLTDQVLMWAADFTFAEAPTPGDADGDRVVDAADYISWKRHFGTPSGDAHRGRLRRQRQRRPRRPVNPQSQPRPSSRPARPQRGRRLHPRAGHVGSARSRRPAPAHPPPTIRVLKRRRQSQSLLGTLVAGLSLFAR